MKTCYDCSHHLLCKYRQTLWDTIVVLPKGDDNHEKYFKTLAESCRHYEVKNGDNSSKTEKT